MTEPNDPPALGVLDALKAPGLQPTTQALLTDDEWRVSVRALGLDRLRELRPMMSEFTPTFRRAVVRHLLDFDGYAPGRKALPAVARSAPELRGRESAR